MVELTPWLSLWMPPIAGLITGAIIGYTVRRARLCSFGAIEDALIGRDWRRMKIFGLALCLAILLTQSMVLADWLDVTKSTYLPPRMPWVSVISGSILFGLGMSFVGTCAFGTLVRLGGGDLRSLVTILVFSIAAYAILRGAVAPLRINVFEQFFVNGPGGRQISFADLANYLSGIPARWIVTLVAGLILFGLAATDKRLWHAPRLLTAALCLGLGVSAGWYFTGVAIDPFAEPVPRLESLTFVAPTARAILLIAVPEPGLLGFGLASVPGVVAGSFAHAVYSRDFRWEAFDDQYEMRRHIAGAVLMGFGGILAGGCTIGQGLSAGSMLSFTWPLTVAGMIIGARIGLSFLLEGSLAGWICSLFTRTSSRIYGNDKNAP